MSNNFFPIVYKTILLALPFIGSVLISLIFLNTSIWIYDGTKVKTSIKKSKKVLFIAIIIILCISSIITLFVTI
jgi:hypothetical protein